MVIQCGRSDMMQMEDGKLCSQIKWPKHNIKPLNTPREIFSVSHNIYKPIEYAEHL